jgi:hypothetical protein
MRVRIARLKAESKKLKVKSGRRRSNFQLSAFCATARLKAKSQKPKAKSKNAAEGAATFSFQLSAFSFWPSALCHLPSAIGHRAGARS